MSHTMLNLEDLVFNNELYPRTGIDEQHVRQFERAMEGGIQLPPIVVSIGSLVIADGVHRYHAHLRRGEKKIASIQKAYADDAELFRDAVMLNSGVGLKLGQDDSLKVLDISERLGLKEIDIAGMLRTSISHLRALKPRYATVTPDEAAKDFSELRQKIPLKGSVRHLAGTEITQEQATAMTSAPGQSYLLTCNQLRDALRHGLIPPQDKHPALWVALGDLRDLITARLG